MTEEEKEVEWVYTKYRGGAAIVGLIIVLLAYFDILK